MSIRNIRDLDETLCRSIEMLEKDPKRLLQVKEMANACGKVIAAQAKKLEYCKLRGEKPDIGFMNVM